MTPAPEEVFTIAPPPCASITGISYFMHRKTPRRSTPTIRSHSSSSTSAVGTSLFGSTPALLNAKSRPPNAPVACFSACCTSSARVTLQRTASDLPPASSINRAVSRLPSSPTSATTTLAPARANASAAARPIPLAAPVTSATFPAKSFFPFAVLIVTSHHQHVPREDEALDRKGVLTALDEAGALGSGRPCATGV